MPDTKRRASNKSLNGLEQACRRRDTKDLLETLPIQSREDVTESIEMRNTPEAKKPSPKKGFKYRTLDVYIRSYGCETENVAIIRLTPKGAFLAERTYSGGITEYVQITSGGSVPRKLVRSVLDIDCETELWICKHDSGKYSGISNVMRANHSRKRSRKRTEPRTKVD